MSDDTKNEQEAAEIVAASEEEAVENEKMAEAKLPPSKPEIQYDDFAKLDVRIGLIKAVEIVDGADKLLKLTVDLGEESPRQIVSGIREFFDDPQYLAGKQCPFVVNLAPRVIRGLESQGMIMAAGGDDSFGLLLPHQELPVGTEVV